MLCSCLDSVALLLVVSVSVVRASSYQIRSSSQVYLMMLYSFHGPEPEAKIEIPQDRLRIAEL
ncbi:hypothetical protein M6B38_286670 [Iris pallida]|uniref:Uncharacterized protein n=1 Tax=Iris pallida TaxID=29817 RepID=A0AAX6HYL3_IRIPA|nr:hypothetical protein M6B38_286670 [Iris pallida]